MREPIFSIHAKAVWVVISQDQTGRGHLPAGNLACEAGTQKTLQIPNRSPLSTLVMRLILPPVRAIFVKDLFVFRRDSRNISQLVTPLIIGFVYAFMLVRSGGEPPPGRGEAPEVFMEILANLMLYANVGISLFIGWSLLSRLVGMSFSLEGKQYWLIKSAPLSSTQILAGKYLVAYLPTLILCWFFLLITSLLQRMAWKS